MKIRKLEVKNFRSLRNITAHFSDCTMLIGRNNAGKSNILRAIRLLLEGGKSDVKDTDFWSKKLPISLFATLDGVNRYLPLSTERHRSKIKTFVANDDLTIAKFYGPTDKEPGKIYLVDPNTGESKIPTGIDAGLKQIIPEAIVVESLADATDEAGIKSSTAMGKIFARVMDAIGAETGPEMSKAFAKINSLLNVNDGEDRRVAEIRDIEASITSYIQQNFRDCRAIVTVAMPTLDDILRGASIELDDGRQTSFRSKGQGLQRALYLSLLRTLADSVRSGGERGLSRPFVLLVEEAELFLHPTAQGQMRTALEMISGAQQVLFSTHSPAMVSPKSLQDVILIRKDPKSGATRVPPPKPIPRKSEKFLLEITSMERGAKFFFADRVMLVEGRSDACLADAIARKLGVRGYEPERHAFVEMGGKDNLPDFRRYLESKGQQAWILVDLDFLLSGAGKVLKADKDLARLVEEAGRIAVEQKPSLADTRKRGMKKQKMIAMLDQVRANPKLGRTKEVVVAKLREKRIFVLTEGEIERYVGLAETSKGKYLQAAHEILSGERTIHFQAELADILGSFVRGHPITGVHARR